MAGMKFGIFLLSLICLGALFYGFIFNIIEQENNMCRMTYMFEYPQFVKIHFRDNHIYPKYGLYVYSEGGLIERTRAMNFFGAPVIFVPGNSGSYKQVRSLASVAIRKGIDNEWLHHLDYFAIDYNEEYSALFGGYLEDQKNYLKICIRAVLNLYRKLENPPKQVIIIGHSMGGKIAQSLLADEEVEPLINTIIALASPIDKPVLNFDSYFNDFYEKIAKTLLENRTAIAFAGNSSNTCRHWDAYENPNNSLPLDKKLLISIGGGNRDLLVHKGLTLSEANDINAITTSIPNVWLTTDHLCSVWCLQLVLAINRFLHSIVISNNRRTFRTGQHFIEDKSARLAKAYTYFVRADRDSNKNRDVNFLEKSHNVEWNEDSRRVFSKMFDYPNNSTTMQMIRLVNAPQYKFLVATAINIENDDWVFGCPAIETQRNMRFCTKGKSLSLFSEKFPSLKEKKSIIMVDLHKIKRNQPTWTHLILKFAPARQPISGFNIDTFDPNQRFLKIMTPKWYSFSHYTALEDTLIGSSFYKIEISGLDETYQSIALNIKPRICSKENHHAVVKVCIPWLKGCEHYQHLTSVENLPVYINIPNAKPSEYNITQNPISVYLHLDANCRYRITYHNSFGGTLAQIVRQFIQWLPAHLTAIALMALRHQITITPSNMDFKCGKLYMGLLSSSSIFIVTTTRIFGKLVLGISFLPKPDDFNNSLIISIIIHGSAFALLMITTGFLWLCIYINGNIAHKILLKVINLPISSITDSIMPIVEKLPISAGILLISIAAGSCGGVAMICGCLIYFMFITKQYESYLEEYVFHTAKLIAMKLFGRKLSSDGEENTTDTNTDDDDNIEESSIENTPKHIEAKKEIIGDTANTNTDTKDLSKKSEILLNTLTNSFDTEFPEDITDEDLDKLLTEAIKKQENLVNEKKLKETLERAEYDSVHESLTNINFNMTMFVLLIFLTLLNLPSTISWAKNYTFNRVLSPDPSFIPACIVLAAISNIWQINAPRNLQGYKWLSYFIYVCAAGCILFSQDSIYRLNFIICAVFVAVTIHQIVFRKNILIEEHDDAETELQNKIDKIKNLMTDEST